MASLAGMLQARGHRITGSDAAAYPPMSDVLAGLGIPLMQPYAEANLEPRPELVIVGNAISRGNVELEYLLDTRIPFTSMAAVLHDEVSPGTRIAGGCGNAWQDDHDEHAGVDLRSSVADAAGVCTVVLDWRRGGELWYELQSAADE
jgi:hypothetical protein